MKPNQPALLLLLAALALPAEAAIDPFYQTLLRDGQHAYDRKDYKVAARDLRLACFGMLDEPRQLADCLVRLALAQDRLNEVEAFRDTFQRLVEIEERFKAYSQAELAPELRAGLEQRLAARIPAATLAGAPAFRATIPVKPESPMATAKAAPPKKGAKKETARKEPAKQDAGKTAPSRTAGQTAAPANGSTAVPPSSAAPVPNGTTAAATPAPADPPAPQPLTEAERGKLEQARRILAEQRGARDLRQAYQLAREVADVHPESQEAQHLAAEGAYRISRWSDAATYFRRGGDPGEDEPERLFYMAVALYESGDRAGAAAALKRSLANLQRTAYVDSYAKKILGQ